MASRRNKTDIDTSIKNNENNRIKLQKIDKIV